jgi:thioredoxin 1
VSDEIGPLHVGDGDYEEKVLRASLPAMVDFWAPWCGPCRMVAPAVEELAREYAGRAIVAKVNTDEHQEWARRLGIRGIPTIIFFKNGVEVDRVVGAVPKHVLQSRLEALLS